MLIKTILNHCHNIKGFVYEEVIFRRNGREEILDVTVRPRKGTKGLCGQCGKAAPTYDTAETGRVFEFIPLWGIKVRLIYHMRRVDCQDCGVKTEKIPWADGKQRLCRGYQLFLGNWARRLSWSEVSRIYHTSWQNVYRSVEWMVRWGLEQRSLENVTAIGIDEVKYRTGPKFLTVVYQLDKGLRRLIWVGRDRNSRTVLRFFRTLGKEGARRLRFICSDMLPAYLKVIKKKAGQAVHIIDRFHVVANLNTALDEVRAEEARKMATEGYEPVLKHTRWCLLKREENLSEKQQFRLTDVLRYDLKTVRGYLIKEAFQCFWKYASPYWAGKYLDKWITRALKSRIGPIMKVANKIRRHRDLILNWFRAKKEFSCGIVEGFNTRIKLTIRKSCGFRTFKAIEMALYHTLGDLPEPVVTHRFW